MSKSTLADQVRDQESVVLVPIIGLKHVIVLLEFRPQTCVFGSTARGDAGRFPSRLEQ